MGDAPPSIRDAFFMFGSKLGRGNPFPRALVSGEQNSRAMCAVSLLPTCAGSWVLDKAYKALYDPKNCSLFLCNRRRSYTFLKYQWKSPGCDLQR